MPEDDATQGLNIDHLRQAWRALMAPRCGVCGRVLPEGQPLMHDDCADAWREFTWWASEQITGKSPN